MTTVDEVLAHHGVKGMKWGKRKAASLPTEVSIKAVPGKKIRTAGGKNIPAHEDALKAAISKTKAKHSTVNSLSNKELQDLVTRMNLEQQFTRLASGEKGAGAKFVDEFLGKTGKEKAKNVKIGANKLSKHLDKVKPIDFSNMTL